MLKTEQEIIDIIRGIPGYDPLRDAEGYRFYPERAERYRVFIETQLQHIEGKVAGQPYILQPHELSIVYNLFGWYDERTNMRRYREALFFVPRKNSKSTFAACLMNAVMFCDSEMRMQCYSLGANLEQANIVKRIVNAQIAANPELERRVKIFKSTHAVELLSDGSIYRSLTADAGTKHGLNTHFCIADEIHAYPNSELIDVIKTSMGARQQPLMVYTTTSDFERESACNKVYDYACKVRDGVLRDAAFLPVIYEVSQKDLDEDPDCWKSPAMWAKANPMLGKSVTLEFLQRECARAMEEPSYENTFKRLYLNIKTETSERMIASEQWAMNDGALPELETRRCVGAALDVASTSDMNSLCLLFDKPGGGYDARWWHWQNKAAADKAEQKHSIPYTEWKRDGWVTIQDGNQIDYEVLRADLNVILKQYKVSQIHVDPLFQGVELCQNLEKDGWNVIYFKCNYVNMTAPTSELLRFIAARQFGHGNNPVMRWQASNAVLVRNKTECMRPGKADSDGKIDGVVTAVMALAMALQNRGPAESIYESRGFIVFDTE